ncbi:flagellar export chaperone FliS [uncultured Desulfuromusa sp.]|uniref:flagellar export chaperone FliS n=1 Tax=uncultured Desulfuromusa sp. TaxID=219183 RepID=UPI002AA85F37|nr:flagellar export chaperone FliS [uncultured Desulfuromusa sp.]
MNAYMNQYQNNQILNASPERILILLYDGSIRFCRQAIHAMDEGKRTVQAEKISRAMAIISEFSNTLNHDVGGEIATDLDALYSFMMRELTSANVKNDRKALETVEDLLIGLRETWVEAIEINRTQQVSKSEPEVRHVAASF